MKVIVAGTRTITDYRLVQTAIESSELDVTEVISGHGGCDCPLTDAAECTVTGVDGLGERWASERGLIVRRHPADWGRFGKSAGPRRNAEMAAYADALVLVWTGSSRGSADMLQKAHERGLRIFQVRVARQRKPRQTLTTGEED